MKKCVLLLVTLAFPIFTDCLFAQGTAFTYQGQLQQDGSPANGSYDLQFILYNASVGGSQTGPILTNSATSVINGLFAVTLDFEAGIFTGTNYWLDIAVRTNGGGTFAELSPRQPLTPAPYAVFAGTSSNLSGTLSVGQLNGTLGNSQLAHNSITLTAGGGLGGGGTVALGGSTTLSNAGVLSITGNPDITATNIGGAVTLSDTATSANTASAIVKRDPSGNFAAGTITATSFSGDGSGLINLIASQLNSIGNTNDNLGNFFVGSSGNATMSGNYNTGYGQAALVNNTSGNANVAVGADALFYNESGFNNIALGAAALGNVMSGSVNIGIGVDAGVSIYTGTNNIDIGNSGSGDESDVIRIGTTQTKAAIAGIYPTTIASAGALVCVNPLGLLGTGTAGGAFLASDLQIGTGAGDYRHVELGGGNSTGFLYGSYPKWGDGVHLGYNYYADASGNDVVANTGGATSRLTVGYGFISLNVGSVNEAPTTQRLLASSSGVTVSGTFNNSSDRNAKQDFTPVSSTEILDKVLRLPLSEWSYKTDAAARHIGPMGQDFYSIFDIGTDEKHIAPIDEGGVALAAIQGLNQKLEQKEREIIELKARLEKLEKLMSQQTGGPK
jgi:hypothetical protein